jgi:formate hydrogenlyase subunit 3/multisubunit Na+/H+ antiporter MnhD subunit
MVSPIYLIILPLAAAFLIPLLDRIARTLSLFVFYATLAVCTALSGIWLYGSLFLEKTALVYTAGFPPPLSIALRMGSYEALILSAAFLTALLASTVLFRRLRGEKPQAMVLFLMVMLGAAGIVLTRDLFNLFVFLEISSIATYAIIALERNVRSLSAGFKYIIAGGIASALFLIGTIFLYRIAGSLAIDDIVSVQPGLQGAAGFTAAFLLIAALLIELKPFPANGWALDVYEAAESSVVSLIAVVNSGAVLYALMKTLPFLDPAALPVLMWAGILTFFFSNLMGLRQENVKRLLGYSSSAQMGLLIALAALREANGLSPKLFALTAGLIFFNHLFSKAGLFWLTSRQQEEKWTSWIGPKGPLGFLIFSLSIAALAGLPPFPAFWAKWSIVVGMLQRAPLFVVLLLGGSLFEALYLLRWYGRTMSLRKGELPPTAKTSELSLRRDPFPLSVAFSGLLFSLALAGMGAAGGITLEIERAIVWFPLAAGAILLLFSWLHSSLLGLLSLLPLAVYGWYILPGLGGLRLIFALLFLGGGALLLVGSLYRKKHSEGFYPLALTVVLSLAGLTVAASLLEFFFLWELMTVSSYLLILLGEEAEAPALNYAGFSLGGAFTVMAGLALLVPAVSAGDLGAAGAAEASVCLLPPAALLAFALLTLGFLIKSGAAGVHVWLPGAYGEADDEATPILSALLSKAGIFGLLLFTILLAPLLGLGPATGTEVAGLPGSGILSTGAPGAGSLGSGTPLGPALLFAALRWVGALTAFFGALMAVFQEDIKRLFAYSSMSQIGYIILSFGLVSHLGWVTAIYISVLHMLFKGLLFLVTAGVVYRTGTRLMYRMGGLIKKMPLSFIGALIGIIAVSGVPPLAGFGAKWLLYTSLIEGGYLLLAAVAFFASTISFLYLFRFIHVVFLGQLKTAHRTVQEAPFILILPQILFLIAIMLLSTFPALLVKPASKAVSILFTPDIAWKGGTLAGSFGYWNAAAVMIVTMAVFGLILLWLLFVQRRPQPVKQFNIVFAAERPHRPETSHFGHNFFAPYRRALGFLVKPYGVRFWDGIREITGSIGGALRRIYNGNGQTYALHIMLFVTVLYFIMEAR